jgi:hypothetical protein
MGMQRFEHVTELPDPEALIARKPRAADWPHRRLREGHATTDLLEAKLPDNAVFVLGNEDDGCV